MAILKLYKNCKIVENENFILREHYLLNFLFTYLNSLSNTLTFSTSQFNQNKLDIEYKIQIDKLDVDFQNDNNYNYACYYTKVDNAGLPIGNPIYYFIRKIEVVSSNCAKLYLHMDVLNSFPPTRASDTDGTGYFKFSKLTHITRQHKNRYSSAVDSYKNPIIDRYSEGINPPLYRGQLYTATASKLGGDNFYLVYKNSHYDADDSSNVVNCYLCADNPIKYALVNTIKTDYYPTDLDQSKSYYILSNYATLKYYDSRSGQETELTGYFMVRILVYGSVMIARIYRYANGTINSDAPIDLGTDVYITHFKLSTGDYYYENTNSNIKLRTDMISTSTRYDVSSTQITATSIVFNNIDRTDSRLIKIIKLPYAPVGNFQYVVPVGAEPYYTLETSNKFSWDNNENMIKVNIDTEFYYSDITLPRSSIYPLTTLSGTPLKSDLRNIAYETKLKHSDFFQPKAIYDSFSRVFQNENMEFYTDTYIQIGFKVTNTINSRFYFDLNEIGSKYADEDFPKILYVARNNEVALFNSPYINYIRSGFNYDVKSKQRQEAFSWISTIATLGAGIGSVVAGSKTLGAGLIASSIISLGSAINTTIQAETNMQAKLNALKYQANSIYGADDIDLMSEYAGNKLRYAIYEVSPRMKNLLFDLFHYTGYIDDVTEIPNTTTRIWFNFLQCEPHFKYINNISQECLEELINRYKGGVTILHSNNINGVLTWDFEREKENWETFFFS